jgi:outer membrane protein TolC
MQSTRLELTPQDVPLAQPIDVSIRQATLTALDQRNDIAAALRKIQAVSARVGAARNQVLPRLDLILGTYVAGLDGKTDVFGAIGNQFSEGGPSYAAGLLFEVPVGNRANQARLNRSRWEMQRVMYEFQQSTEVAFAEVEVAVRETRTTFNEMVTKKQAIEASENEVNYLWQRWELLPDPNESAVLLIDDLLDAQERLADEERAFVRAQVSYAMSWVQFRKATGVLLRMNDQVPFASEEMTVEAPPERVMIP